MKIGNDKPKARKDKFNVNLQIVDLTVFILSQQILKLGLKIRSFSKSTFPGLSKNILTFNPKWLEDRVLVAQNY